MMLVMHGDLTESHREAWSGVLCCLQLPSSSQASRQPGQYGDSAHVSNQYY